MSPPIAAGTIMMCTTSNLPMIVLGRELAAED